jgi:ribonuclease P protein component
MAYAVGRKVGGAVARNRVRRRLRAIARQERHLLQSGSYLVAAGAGAARMPYRELESALREALTALQEVEE